MHNIREVVAFVMESKYGEHQKKKKTLAIFTLKASFFISWEIIIRIYNISIRGLLNKLISFKIILYMMIKDHTTCWNNI
jgi:hypothetical protein